MLDADYIRLARQGIAGYHVGRLKLRPLGKPVHRPSGREKITQIRLDWLR